MLRDLSLHLLDLLENAIAAGATTVWVRFAEHPRENRLEMEVEDNGSGLSVLPEQALNPFYTTKKNKRTGLGLPLLQTTAEQAGGGLTLTRSTFGGLKVHVTLQRDHVDRIPLGDVAATLSGIACTHPDLEICCELAVADQRFEMRVSELTGGTQQRQCDPIALAQVVCETIALGQQKVGMSA